MRDVIAALNEALERNEPVALATVVDVQGASPTQVGFKLLVQTDGSAVGNIGGGDLEQRVREEAIAALRPGCSTSHCVRRNRMPWARYAAAT